LKAATRATVEDAFIRFVQEHDINFLAWCGERWWQWSREGWRPFSHDRYLLPRLQQLGAEFAVSGVTDQANEDRAEWLRSLPADHRLLPLCRRLRVVLQAECLAATSHLPSSEPPAPPFER
jgi:hypothetical protein